jgi:phenylacetate-coenzyme A ligase PaaK-like adenylate-forming protein
MKVACAIRRRTAVNGGIGVKRLTDFARAVRMGRRELAASGSLSAGEIRSRQQRLFGELFGYVVAHSPFYRELYAGIDGIPADPTALPPVTKARLMERFDDWVTDPKLRLADLEGHLRGLAGDQLYLGQYRVMASSGTTGRRGVFVFSRADWLVNLANFARITEQLLEVHPRLPRVRAASVAATDPLHISARTSVAAGVGVNRVLRLDARQPLAELVDQLNAFQPEVLFGYPSILALLADEQQSGRLPVRPAKVTTVSEVRTPDMEQKIDEAWGVSPFNWYGISEGGVLAADCAHHQGMHVFEDLFIVENVDEHGRPVPDGVVGAKVLLTNLFNRTQPIIRYEISDMVALDSRPCPCGRSLRRTVLIEGRTSEILRLPGVAGGTVAVHPFAIESAFTGMRDVRQYKVVHEGTVLRILVIPQPDVDAEGLVDRIREAVRGALAAAGARPAVIHVDPVPALARDQGHGAKFKLIESRP